MRQAYLVKKNASFFLGCRRFCTSALFTRPTSYNAQRLANSGYQLSIPVSVQPLIVELRDDGGRTARGESAALLTKADRRPLDSDAVEGAVGGLGGSTVALRRLDLSGLDLGAGAWCSFIMLWLGLGQHPMKHLIRHSSHWCRHATAWDLSVLAQTPCCAWSLLMHAHVPMCQTANTMVCWLKTLCYAARIASRNALCLLVQCRPVHSAGRDQGRAPCRIGALLRIAAAPCVRHGPRTAAGAAGAAGRR